MKRLTSEGDKRWNIFMGNIVRASSKGEVQTFMASRLFLATGRGANNAHISDLPIKLANTAHDGFVVSNTLQTSVPGVYAERRCELCGRLPVVCLYCCGGRKARCAQRSENNPWSTAGGDRLFSRTGGCIYLSRCRRRRPWYHRRPC
jgi:hypothetical protein